MSVQTQERDPILKLYADLIQKACPTIKAIYYGDPIRIPASSLPALIVTRRMSNATYGTSAEDEHAMQMVFTLVTDVRRDISDDSLLSPGWTRLFDMVEGRDPTTLLLKTNSLLYVLRHNFAVANNLWTDVQGPTRVDYGLVANKREKESWSLEAAITTTCTLVQLR